jgi:hypothetical protein
MDEKRRWTKTSAENFDQLQALVERGRRLHDQAVLEGVDWMVSALARVSKRCLRLVTGDRGMRTPGKVSVASRASDIPA